MSSTATLETFPSPRPEREFEITISCPEFTSVCPMSGLPDFGEIRITYVPADRCIELKSLKYYMVSYRDRGVFYEAATNQILDDLVAACRPRRMTVVGDFTVRGGIKTVVTASFDAASQKRSFDAGGQKRSFDAAARAGRSTPQARTGRSPRARTKPRKA